MFRKDRGDNSSSVDILLVVVAAVGAAATAGVTAYFQNRKHIRQA